MKETSAAATMSAITTHHFTLQGALGTAATEAGTRASLYFYALSATLIATGFMIQAKDAFVPFVALTVPALFLVGLFTVIRLVDIGLEVIAARAAMARILNWYATLGEDAAAMFGEQPPFTVLINTTPALRFGPLFGGLTTIAAMIASINAIVAAAGLSLLLRALAFATSLAVAAGATLGIALITLFYVYQTLRLRETVARSEAGMAS